MTDLEQLELRLLQDARSYLEPESTDEARLFPQIAAKLGLHGVVSAPQTPSGSGFSSRLAQVIASKKAIAVICTALGVAAGFDVGFAAGRQRRPVEFASHPALPVTPGAQKEVPSAGLVQSPPGATAPLVEAASLTRSKSALLRKSQTAIDSEGSALAAAPIDVLGQEVALLKRAEHAIRSGDALLSLGLLRELARRFPNGKLLAERNAAFVMANCLQLEPAGEAYLRQATNSVYHERVRQLCGLAAPAGLKNNKIGEKGSVSAGD